MSLYDEATLVLLPGAEAGKNGKIYNAKPAVEKLGENLVIDGGFDDPSVWSVSHNPDNGEFGFTVANGKATATGAQTASISIWNSATNFLKPGRMYKLQFDILDRTAGTATIKVGNNATTANGSRATDKDRNGTYVEYLFVQTDSTFYGFQIVANSDFVGSIDNVTCQEVISKPEDWKLNRGIDTSVSRVIDGNIIDTQKRNLVQWSNRLDLWAPDTSYYDTPTTGHEGYDGSNRAWLLNKTSAVDNSYVGHGRVIGGTNMFSWSMYAKMGTAPVLLMYSPAFAIAFDLENGSVFGGDWTSLVGGNNGNAGWKTYGKIEDVGNGWYRCTATGYGTVYSGLYNPDPGGNHDSFRFQPRGRNADNTNHVIAAGSIYVMDMQVEYGLDSTEFIPTAGDTNLLMDSSRLHSPEWTRSGIQTIKLNIKGYDGTSNAYELIRSGQYGRLEQNYRRYWGQQVASVYAKAGTAPYMTLRLDRLDEDSYNTILATHLATFDLENGVVVSDSGGTLNNANIEDAGNGWYRCSIQGNFGTDIFRIYPSQSTSPYQGFDDTTATSIYIQDPQFEEGEGVGGVGLPSPIKRTSSIRGLDEDSPRFDNLSDNLSEPSCPALTLEPQRTNLVPNSIGLPQGNSNVDIYRNYSGAPDGTKTATYVTKRRGQATDGDTHQNDRIIPLTDSSVTLTANRWYAVSCFVKNPSWLGGGSMPIGANTTIGWRGTGDQLIRRSFQWNGLALEDGTTGSSSYTQPIASSIIRKYYSNGWWRIGFSFKAPSTTGAFEIDLDRSTVGAAGNGLLVWGFQLEQGNLSLGSWSDATDTYYPGARTVGSYIPTYGTASTRTAETCELLDLRPNGLDGKDVSYLVKFKNNNDVRRDHPSNNIRIGESSNLGSLRLYRASDNDQHITTVFQNNANVFNPGGYQATYHNHLMVTREWETGRIKVFNNGFEQRDAIELDMDTWAQINMDGTGSLVEVAELAVFPFTMSDVDAKIATGTSYASFAEAADALNYTIHD